MPIRDLKLPVDVHAPSRARHALDDAREDLSADVLERFHMAVSELVTNAVQHAGLAPSDELTVAIIIRGDRIRVELSYPGPSFATEPREPEPTEESGRGLLLVERAVSRWGSGSVDGAQTWFEIDLRNGEGGSRSP